MNDKGTTIDIEPLTPILSDKTPLVDKYNLTDEEPTFCRRFVIVVKHMRIESCLFLFMVSYMISIVSLQDLLMKKACSVSYGYNKSICDNLDNESYSDIKSEMEAMSTDYSLYGNIIRTIPSSIISLFVGAWSDKYGRKLPILISAFGFVLFDVCLILNSYFIDSKIEYVLFASVPTGLGGGLIVTYTISYSYIYDSTVSEQRTLKYALLEFCIFGGIPLGQFLGGMLFEYFSYIGVFSGAAFGHVLSIVFIVLIVKETRGLDIDISLKEAIKDFFFSRTYKRLLQSLYEKQRK